jgi:hypothetical protein
MPRTKKYKIGGSQYTQAYVNNPDIMFYCLVKEKGI